MRTLLLVALMATTATAQTLRVEKRPARVVQSDIRTLAPAVRHMKREARKARIERRAAHPFYEYAVHQSALRVERELQHEAREIDQQLEYLRAEWRLSRAGVKTRPVNKGREFDGGYGWLLYARGDEAVIRYAGSGQLEAIAIADMGAGDREYTLSRMKGRK